MRPNKYPSPEEIVMVLPNKITDSGVYVTLLEYNLGGFIKLADLSKSRIRSMSKVVQIGKKFPAVVLSVDEETENILLSKKDVRDTEVLECEKNFKESKYIQDIAQLFKRRMLKDYSIEIDLQEFYNTFIWKISHDASTIITALRTAAKDFNKVYLELPNSIKQGEPATSYCGKNNIDNKWIDCFREVLACKFKETNVIVEAVVEITCESQNGVNIIKNALLAGCSLSNESCPFNVKVIKPPFYAITIKTYTPLAAIEPIMNAISEIQRVLNENNGVLKIIKEPQVVIDKEFEPNESDSENGTESD